jgi:hypothetical protein
MKPKDVVLRSTGLVGRLSQTKTSGAGRRVRDLPLFIPRGAYVVQENWLEVGYQLWEMVGNKDRDYFLPRLKGDLEEFFELPASSGDMAILGRKVLAELKVPVLVKHASEQDIEGGLGVWREGGAVLIPAPLLGGWTGHSER